MCVIIAIVARARPRDHFNSVFNSVAHLKDDDDDDDDDGGANKVVSGRAARRKCSARVLVVAVAARQWDRFSSFATNRPNNWPVATLRDLLLLASCFWRRA